MWLYLQLEWAQGAQDKDNMEPVPGSRARTLTQVEVFCRLGSFHVWWVSYFLNYLQTWSPGCGDAFLVGAATMSADLKLLMCCLHWCQLLVLALHKLVKFTGAEVMYLCRHHCLESYNIALTRTCFGVNPSVHLAGWCQNERYRKLQAMWKQPRARPLWTSDRCYYSLWNMVSVELFHCL